MSNQKKSRPLSVAEANELVNTASMCSIDARTATQRAETRNTRRDYLRAAKAHAQAALAIDLALEACEQYEWEQTWRMFDLDRKAHTELAASLRAKADAL